MALRLLTIEKWKKYLNDIGITDPYAKDYAVTLNKQQVPKDLLSLMSDNELRDTYGITLGGHRLIIRHNNSAQASTSSHTTTTLESGTPHLRHQAPQLQPTMSPSAFRAFITHWNVYKNLVGIRSNGSDTAAQLFSLTCNDHPELRRTISDHKADHLSLSEPEYLDMLKRVVTAQANPETYRKNFFKMEHHSGESCRQWC